MKKKKTGAFGAGQFSLGTLVGGRPGTTIQGGGGGLGGSYTRTRPGHPPGGVVQHDDPISKVTNTLWVGNQLTEGALHPGTGIK